MLLSLLPFILEGCVLIPGERRADACLPVFGKNFGTEVSHPLYPGSERFAPQKKQKGDISLSRRERRKAEEEKLWKSHKRRIEKMLRQHQNKAKKSR